MLLGSSPCELRLLLPDSTIGTDGFHDVIIENLSASTTWHSRHVSPSDVTALRRRWPKTVFREMQRRGGEMERLRRQACQRPEWAYRHSQPELCPICKTWVESSLEVHMMCFHLELGQLWRYPFEWCAMWKGSVSDCREHFNNKHGGSASLEFGNASRSFPPWTVTWKIWQTALRTDVLRWTYGCSMRRGAAWYTSTVCTRTHYHIRRFVRALYPSYFRLLTGPWPSPSSLNYAYRYQRRAHPQGRYRRTVSQVWFVRRVPQLHIESRSLRRSLLWK